MLYYYDNYGWLTEQPIEGRSTDQVPPEAVGGQRPNWTGLEWALVEYTAPPAPQPVKVRRWLSKLGFRNRFTPAEKARLELAAADNPNATLQARMVSASVRAALADQRDATYIDLDRDDLRAGVMQQEQANLLDHAGRALEILDAPVQDHEAYKG